MTHYGILVPPDPAPGETLAPHRIVTWEDRPEGGGLLAMLYREVGHTLDAATVVPDGGPVPGGLRLWCLDDGLLADDPDYNDRALGICRWFGYNVPALAGSVVFIGCPAGEDEAGLHPSMRAWLSDGLDRMAKLLGELT